jgi:hypothetical protein
VSPKSSRYSAGQRVTLQDGKSGRVIGVDPINGTYQVMTADNRSVRVKATDIDKLEKPNDVAYQKSGPNRENEAELSIKDTPFDLNQDK